VRISFCLCIAVSDGEEDISPSFKVGEDIWALKGLGKLVHLIGTSRLR
jgi:hypothetical protein